MFSKLRALLPANRIAALIGVATSIAAFLVTLQTSFIPGSPAAEAIAKATVMLGSIAGALKIIDKFLDGSQQWDALLLAGADPDPDPDVPGYPESIHGPSE